MIVPMKKVTVLCLERHREEALEYLRQLGALHVEPVRTAEHESVEAARRHYEHIRTALDLLPERPSALPSGRTPGQTVEALWALLHERAALRDEREPLAHEIARWAPTLAEKWRVWQTAVQFTRTDTAKMLKKREIGE